MKKVAGKFGQTEKCVYFCTRISDLGQMLSFFKDRDLAQLVAHTSGGREVAGSSPVIPTKTKDKVLKFSTLIFFYTSKGLLSENKWPVAHATRGGDGRQEGRESSY